MYFVVYWIILYFLELIKMGLITVRLLDYKSNKKYYTYFIGLISMFLVISITYIGLINETILSFLFMIIIIFVFYQVLIGHRKFLGILLSHILLSIIDIILSGGLAFLFKIDTDMLIHNYFIRFIGNLLIVPLLFIIVLIKNKKDLNMERIRLYLKSQHILLMILGIFACGLYIAPIQIYGLTESGSYVRNLVTFGFTISGLVFILLCIFFFLGNADKIQYRQMMEAKEKLLVQQQQYYKARIEKDENTKKFRHDISNHIYCMSYLCKAKKYDELEKYLTSMESTIQELSLKIYTGNEVLNIIVNDLLERYKDNHIQFLWIGMVPEHIKLSAMDICTIFSNLLINAIEAVVKIENYSKRIIKVQIKLLDENMVINISNPVSEKINIINNRLISSKKDKGQHGYGSLNVQECVERYKGDISYSCDVNYFTVEILLYNMLIIK